MKIKKNKKLLILMLVIVGIFSLSLTFKSYSNKIVDNVEDAKDVSNIKRKQFSMYVENDSGEYDEYNSSELFPIGYELNLDKSTCVDINGLEVPNILSSNGNAVTVTSNKTVFCYVYFDLDNSLNSKVLNSSDIWDMTAEVGIDVMDVQEYRYVGTNPSNYICFGTSDKNVCLNDTDKYMYRIIGVFEDTDGSMHTKLIKKEAINVPYPWDASSSNDGWEAASLYKGLNGINGGEYGNVFVNSEEYLYMKENSVWYNKITAWDYTLAEGNIYSADIAAGYYYSTVKSIYLHELNRSGRTNATCYYNSSNVDYCDTGEWSTVSAKVGLMYASDYALSLGSVALSYDNSNSSTMKTGWMHLSNNDTGAPEDNDATLSLFNYNHCYSVGYGGSIYYVSDTYDISSRPVFYLTSDVEYSSGAGTITDPFLIKK